MARNFAEIAFTDAVKAMQEKAGSRASYARMEKSTYTDGLTENEAEYIAQRDSFYMASVGENGYPYIQHRGGPKGFLKVIDPHRLGFVDFRGNLQYISVGNLATHDKVSLILMDYPARARLKVFARAEVVGLQDDPALLGLLDPTEYKHKAERMMIFHVEAYDWNCPQHITPRYTAEEIEEAFAPQREYVKMLEIELKALKSRLGEQGL